MLEQIVAIQPGLAWLLANVPNALTGKLRDDVTSILEDLVLKHGRLQGQAIAEAAKPLFSDEEQFREFLAETIVDAGEQELVAAGETIEDVDRIDAFTADVIQTIESTFDVTGVTRETRLVGDLNIDSLDKTELMVLLEDEYGIEIPQGEADDLETVGQIIDYITNQ